MDANKGAEISREPSEEAPEVLAEQEMSRRGDMMASSNTYQKVCTHVIHKDAVLPVMLKCKHSLCVQMIEQKEKELRDSILANYARIKDVEKELSNLQLQLKLTAGPKKHALELMRKKIEMQGEKVSHIRGKYNAAKQVCQCSSMTPHEVAARPLCMHTPAPHAWGLIASALACASIRVDSSNRV